MPASYCPSWPVGRLLTGAKDVCGSSHQLADWLILLHPSNAPLKRGFRDEPQTRIRSGSERLDVAQLVTDPLGAVQRLGVPANQANRIGSP